MGLKVECVSNLIWNSFGAIVKVEKERKQVFWTYMELSLTFLVSLGSVFAILCLLTNYSKLDIW